MLQKVLRIVPSVAGEELMECLRKFWIKSHFGSKGVRLFAWHYLFSSTLLKIFLKTTSLLTCLCQRTLSYGQKPSGLHLCAPLLCETSPHLLQQTANQLIKELTIRKFCFKLLEHFVEIHQSCLEFWK